MQLAKGCMLDSRHGNDNVVNCLCGWKEEVHIHSKVGQLTISDIKQTAVRLWPHSRTQNKKSVPIHRVTSAAEDARWIDRLWESVPGLSYTRWLPTTLNSQRRRNSETWRPSFVFSANFTRAKTVRKISARVWKRIHQRRRVAPSWRNGYACSTTWSTRSLENRCSTALAWTNVGVEAGTTALAADPETKRTSVAVCKAAQ